MAKPTVAALRWIGVAALAITTAVVTAPSPAMALPDVVLNGGSTTIAEEFEHTNYGGGRITVKVGFTCTTSGSDLDFGLGNMPTGWNNAVSSFKNYANCDANHYDGAGFTGLSTGYADSTTNIGSSMNEKTSSIKYS